MITTMLLAALSTLSIRQSDTLAPPRRAHHALVYDEVNRRVLLTGGSTPVDSGRRFVFFNDLWSFDGARWQELPPSGTRSSGMRLVADASKRILSFGGYDGSRSLGDLRALEAGTWRTIAQDSAAPAAEAGFVYDARRNRMVTFGGSPGPRQINTDTREFDGTRWARVETASPPARQAHVMAYDERRGRTVLFGGMGNGGGPGQRPPMLGDTWEYDGAAWTERKVAGPSPRNGAGVTYDSKRGLVILFGGDGADGLLGDTWSWDGTTWRKLAETGPEPRAMGYMAYDKGRDRVVLFGGRKGDPNGDLNDTWEWDGAAWIRWTH